MDAQLEDDLAAMGIASPVTKATAGSLYHQELSRQARPRRRRMRRGHTRWRTRLLSLQSGRRALRGLRALLSACVCVKS